MSNLRDQGQLFDLLDDTLDAFGGDVSRWPGDVRAKLDALIANDGEARRRMAEARALDKLLGQAPALPEARQRALVDQIVAKALRQPRMVAATSAAPPRKAESLLRANTWAAGALAASLVLGLLAGQLPAINALTEMALGDEARQQQVAQSLDADTLWDEDLL